MKDLESKKNLINPNYKGLSIKKQCCLLKVPRSTYYYHPIPETDENLVLMQEIDKYYLNHPSHGSRLITGYLKNLGYNVNRKRVVRLMKLLGLMALYPKPRRESYYKKYGKFPYLLNGLVIHPENHVWGTDITYIPVHNGYYYLVAVLDIYSRYVLSWKLSNSLDSGFCIEAIEEALQFGKPKIMNSDQGVQFTSSSYIELLKKNAINISMSGKGRCWDNIFVERFWRTLKYDEVYLKDYTDSQDAYAGIQEFIEFYNYERPHSALNYRTPAEIYRRI